MLLYQAAAPICAAAAGPPSSDTSQPLQHSVLNCQGESRETQSQQWFDIRTLIPEFTSAPAGTVVHAAGVSQQLQQRSILEGNNARPFSTSDDNGPRQCGQSDSPTISTSPPAQHKIQHR